MAARLSSQCYRQSYRPVRLSVRHAASGLPYLYNVSIGYFPWDAAIRKGLEMRSIVFRVRVSAWTCSLIPRDAHDG